MNVCLVSKYIKSINMKLFDTEIYFDDDVRVSLLSCEVSIVSG